MAYEFSGDLKSSTYYFANAPVRNASKLNAPSRQDNLTPLLLLKPSLEIGPKDSVNLKLQGFARVNTAAKASPENFYADLQQGYLAWSTQLVKVHAGMQTLDWSVVHVLSPSDVTNPKVLFEPFDHIRRASPLLDVALGDEKVVRVEALYIPRASPAVVAGRDSHWQPAVDITSPRVSRRALDHNGGLRVSRLQGALRLQAFYFDGAKPTPKIQEASQTKFEPLIYRVRTGGLGAEWLMGEWTLRAESVYQKTGSQAPSLARYVFTNALSLDTQTEIKNLPTHLSLQISEAQNAEAEDNFITSAQRIFDHSISLDVSCAYSDKISLKSLLVINLQAQALMARLGFEQILTSKLLWGLTWNEFAAAKPDWSKTYQRNDFAQLDLTYRF